MNRSALVESAVQELKILDTAKIQSSLAPQIFDIKWVNSGKDNATVIVEGCNFFCGTKVVIDGKTLREEDGTLTLKSDQALEFETSIEALATGNAVLSGRFGSSVKLMIPGEKCPFGSLVIEQATIPASKSNSYRISVDIKGLDTNGDDKDLTIDDLNQWPDPILFVGSEPVPMPYDFYDKEPPATASGTATGNSSDMPSAAVKTESSGSVKITKKYVKVEAWLPEKTLDEIATVSFRVPFCSMEYQSSKPLSLSRPKVTRLGEHGSNTIFRIYYAWGFGTSVSIEMDKTYFEGPPALTRSSPTELRFTVPTGIVSQFHSLIVRTGSADSYLLSIPIDDKLPRKPTLDASAKPLQVAKGSRGPVEWVGSALDAITAVSLGDVSQQFSSYANGTRLFVYLSEGSTATEGKKTVECTGPAGEKLSLPLFVTKNDPK